MNPMNKEDKNDNVLQRKVGIGRKRSGEMRKKREDVYKGMCVGGMIVFPMKELIQSGII
jgi:hypothetical protein